MPTVALFAAHSPTFSCQQSALCVVRSSAFSLPAVQHKAHLGGACMLTCTHSCHKMPHSCMPSNEHGLVQSCAVNFSPAPPKPHGMGTCMMLACSAQGGQHRAPAEAVAHKASPMLDPLSAGMSVMPASPPSRRARRFPPLAPLLLFLQSLLLLVLLQLPQPGSRGYPQGARASSAHGGTALRGAR